MSIKIKTHLALLIIAALAILLCPASIQAANGEPVNIYLFWTRAAPIAPAEKEYLAKLAGRDRNLKIVTFELN